MNQYFSTSKALVAGTALMVMTVLTTGLFAPESFLMRFADTSTEFAILRMMVLSMLVGLFLSSPPRSKAFRVILAIVSAILASISISFLYSYNMNILDAIIFIEVAIICAVEALELRESSVDTTAKRVKVTSV